MLLPPHPSRSSQTVFYNPSAVTTIYPFNQPIMSLPLGLSFGDLLAVSDLARKLIKALSESQGSPAEVRSLYEVLTSLMNSVEATAKVYLYLQSPAAGRVIDDGLLNGIQHELIHCKQHMETFLGGAKPYAESLIGRRGGWGRRNWKKIKWSLYGEEGVQKLRRLLQGHLCAFNIYASAIIW